MTEPLVRGLAILLIVIAAAAATAGQPEPSIEAVHVLDDSPLPVPGGDPHGFRLGGLSDLALSRDGSGDGIELWAVTDRGPNGSLVEIVAEGAPPKASRTLPVADFAPLLVRVEPDAEGRLRAAATMPLTMSPGRPASGRPAAVDPRAKPIVDPRTRGAIPVDPDGFDTEGLARLSDGRFWIAEEYLPSLALVAADGRVLRRLVPRGTLLPGASCPVEDTLPAACAARRENRGFESLALAPDGSRLFTLLQSPPAAAPPAAAEPVPPDTDVPLVVLDPDSGRVLATFAYPLGRGDDDTCPWCVAKVDGKVSAIAATGPRTLLVLEQSDTDSRLYRVELPAGAAPGPAALSKSLVADLGLLAGRFQADIMPGSSAAPERLSDLKFEGMALLAPDLVLLVNDNDFDIAADGGGPASPPARRTCLWRVHLPQAVR